MAKRPFRRMALALFAALALLASSGCFPGDFQFDKLTQDVKNPPPSKASSSKATPHNYGAPQPQVFVFDGGGGG